MRSIFFTVVLCIFSFQISTAQWQPDVRLTNNSALSNTSFTRCINASGNIVHVVWYDNRDGNNEIYYKRSTDEGISFGADTRLTNAPFDSWFPSVSVSGQVVHVVWSDKRDGNEEIYYKRSTDGGINWGTDTRLSNNSADSWYPSVSVSGSVVHVAWNDNRDGNSEIYYQRSSDGGASWGADTRLSNTPDISASPSISISASNVHIVWCDNRDGNYEIYYKRSTDAGLSWGADTRLSNAPEYSWYPSVSVSGQAVHVLWMDFRDGNFEIYYKRSTNEGVSWEADTRLTNAIGNSNYPSVSVSGQVVHVVWYDNRDGNYEIYYKRSINGGVSWEADTRLTENAPAPSIYTSISVSGQVVHVVWSDLRDGNLEIYYKREPTGNPVGIINIDSEIPNRFSLYQNFPNPFNPSTVIKFQVPSSSSVKLIIYNALGREVESLVDEQLNAGTYEAVWNADKFSSGVYYYTIISGDYKETRSMVLLR